MIVAGSIESVTINGRLFPVSADADPNRDLGGFTVQIVPNGDGTVRKIKTRKPWKIGGLTLAVDDARGDQEFLQDVADSNDLANMLVTHPSGISYRGKGSLDEGLEYSSANGTAEVTLAGEKKLEQQ